MTATCNAERVRIALIRCLAAPATAGCRGPIDRRAVAQVPDDGRAHETAATTSADDVGPPGDRRSNGWAESPGLRRLWSGEPVQLEAFDRLSPVSVRLHPDGRRVAFISGERRGEIWVLEGLPGADRVSAGAGSSGDSR